MLVRCFTAQHFDIDRRSRSQFRERALVNLRLVMLPLLRAITVASVPSTPCSLRRPLQIDPPDVRVLGVVEVPGQIEPTIGRVGVFLKTLAIDGVHFHALTVGRDADDAVAGQRMAALGQVQRHTGGHPFDRDCLDRFGGMAQAGLIEIDHLVVAGCARAGVDCNQHFAADKAPSPTLSPPGPRSSQRRALSSTPARPFVDSS